MYYSNNDVRIEQRPAPKIADNEILARVHASGICGSDVMEWYRKDKVPLVLGHEIGAEIVEAGRKVLNYKKGQRITAAHHVPCDECHFCKNGHHSVCETLRKTNFDPGGFAEYLRLSGINVKKGVFLLPENVSYEEATFIEPLACILRGQRLANMRPGKSVFVIGSGISGNLHIKSARLKGASFIMASDLIGFRLKTAEKSGADIAVGAKEYKPEIFQKANNGLLADLVIVCTAADIAIERAINSVERGGTILFFAPVDKKATITIPFNKLFWRNEITLISSYAANPDEYTEALKLIAGGKIKVNDLITHILQIEKIGEGFELTAKAGDSLKIIIEPQK